MFITEPEELSSSTWFPVVGGGGGVAEASVVKVPSALVARFPPASLDLTLKWYRVLADSPVIL